MSRSGYSDDCDGWDLIRWRGAVNSALRGKRGQALLTDMARALDNMPVKRLVADELVTNTGECCALGALGLARGLNMEGVDPEDRNRVAKLFDIAPALAAEVVFMNDEASWYDETPERRWERMRKWVTTNIKES